MNAPLCRILIADDHDLIRRGVRALLESQPGWEVCGEAADGRSAVRMAGRLRPDLVVLDIGMPELNGIEAIRQIKAERPEASILALSLHDSEQLVHDVLAAGARGYVLKSDASERLVAGVRTLLEGGTFLTPLVESMVLAGYLRRDQPADRPPAPSALSAREREVVQLLAEGRCNKEVASALGISVHTAESHRASIMRKLDLHSITELVHYAIRNGIVVA
jgi:DNA-binding NarL/FixJ family response regulator